MQASEAQAQVQVPALAQVQVPVLAQAQVPVLAQAQALSQALVLVSVP